jgi:glycosyltransferase involved in cell wall biosynthesis
MNLSVILPIYNEEKNVAILYDELNKVLPGLKLEYEIICVNDGSKDKSLEELKKIAAIDKNFKVINFIHNFGQTAAMSAGINSATGDIIIPMDSDLQNDPADIPKFLDKINEGYDVVAGWRQSRWQGSFLKRKLPSMIANWLIGTITNVKLHDAGCSMKAYKREVIQGLNLYGEMHRFIAAYVSWKRGNIAEIPVNSRERIYGETKYGLSRTFKVILDLIVFKFISKYMNKPIHFFGGLGFISFFLGFATGLAAVILKIFHIRDFVATPLPIFTALLIIVGVQLIALGVISEILMRIYYESQNKYPYIIKEKINFN